jgi:CheY-like chemotaxis protein
MTFDQIVSLTIECSPSTSVAPENQFATIQEHVELPAHEPAVASRCGLGSDLPAAADDTTVLVVDDDDVLRSIICEALRRAGYHTAGRSSAKEALEFLLARKSSRNVLVTDLVLNGGEGGWSLSQQVRRLFPSVPIVLMSGCIDESAVPLAIAQGNVSFLQKPFEISTLVSSLRLLGAAA